MLIADYELRACMETNFEQGNPALGVPPSGGPGVHPPKGGTPNRFSIRALTDVKKD